MKTIGFAMIVIGAAWLVLAAGCAALLPQPAGPDRSSPASRPDAAPYPLPDAAMAIIGLADRGQYTGVKITRLTETEVYFTTPDGTFGVRLIAEIPQIMLRDNASFNKAEDLLAADKFADAVVAYKVALARQSDGDLKTLVEARLALAEEFATSGRPKPASRPAIQPTPEPSKTLTLDLGNKVTMKLVLIPAGKFMMGSPADEKDRSENEGPQHEVAISKPFHMGIYEVTQEQYEQVMGKNPSKFNGAQNPVETVSRDDAVEFCKKLSQKTGKTVRLPTEAEWEYACRAGSKTRFGFGDDDDKLGDYAWYSKNSVSTTHPVGQKKPNDWGLYDMHGNAWEWCSDGYAESYANANKSDPTGPASGTLRVLRGGGWGNYPQSCRSANRFGNAPDLRDFNFGFRVVVDLK